MRISDWSSDVCSSDLALRFLDPAHLDLGSIVLAPGIMAEGTAGQRPGAQTPAIEDPIGGNTRMLEQIGVVMKQFVIEIGLGDGLEILVGEAPAIFVDDRVTGRVHRDRLRGDRKSTRLNSSH